MSSPPLSDSSASTRRLLSGLEAMAVAALCFSLMSLFVKLLGPHFSTQQVVFIRNLLNLVLTGALLAQRRVNPLGKHRFLLMVRGLTGFAALSCFFYVLTRLPLAVATVIQFTNPIFTALLAALLLGERGGRRLFLSTFIGLMGVALIAEPWHSSHSALSLSALGLALLGAILTSIAYVSIRYLSTREDPLVTIFYFPLVATPVSLLASIPGWVWPDSYEWLLLLGVGGTSQLGQIFLTRGLYRERAGRATTVGYLQLAFAAVWGFLFFGEIPGIFTFLGSSLILISLLVLTEFRVRTRVGS